MRRVGRSASVGAWSIAAALGAASAGGCASQKADPTPRQPYKVVLLPVEGAARALAAQAGTDDAAGEMVPLAMTPEELGAHVAAGVRASNAFSQIIDAPESVRAAGGAFAGDELTAAADFARRSDADLILRVTVKSARIRDLGNNSSTFWSTFTWFMLPLPVWAVDDRTYDTNLAIEAALYEPRDTAKPTASVVAASGEQKLDLWDRGLSVWVPIVPPAFLAGNMKTVSETVTELAMEQVMKKLVDELRKREIPARFELSVAPSGDAVAIVVGTRRQLRSIDVFADGKLVKSWAETDLVPEKDSTDERHVYRRSVPAAPGARSEVRVVAEDESGGREVRTILLGGGK
ncbi:MAG: hypothetical protein K8T90_22525 [Planctomycetes bacterium]|nr:hypothetical protein [Planctomycetota bacterium]